MRNKMEMGNSTNPEKSSYYQNNQDKLVKPFVASFSSKDERFDESFVVHAIAWILDRDENNDTFSPLEIHALIENVNVVKTAQKDKKISEKAPWFEKLKTKMLTFTIWAAGVDDPFQKNPDSTDSTKK